MIAIGCDHGGYDLKNEIIKHLEERNIPYKDFGIHENRSVDYPDIALPVCLSVKDKTAEKGILVCGTGIGMSIAANKVSGIRAAVCTDHFSTRFTRLHNNTNVLCLGGRVIGTGLALELVDLFLDTPFEGGRHQTRIDKIADIENGGY